jgi:hypothetical protein
MNIIVAFVAMSFCIREYQGRVTLPAVDHGMLSDQGQFCFVVVKRINLFIKLPAFWAMTGFACDLKIDTMRRAGLSVHEDQEQIENQK